MQRAPLRPLPARPRGPVEPDEALSRVRARLPALDEPAVTTLALVAIAGRPRADVAAERGESEEELATNLARARKALRRDVAPLPGSGWCERAERIISDRIDGVAAARDTRILAVHLPNCDRCAEHERRLVQAQDALVDELAEALEQAPSVPAVAPALHVVSEAVTEPVGSSAPVVADAAVAAAVRPLRSAAAGAAWNVATVVAVALAMLSVAVAVAGALGAAISF